MIEEIEETFYNEEVQSVGHKFGIDCVKKAAEAVAAVNTKLERSFVVLRGVTAVLSISVAQMYDHFDKKIDAETCFDLAIKLLKESKEDMCSSVKRVSEIKRDAGLKGIEEILDLLKKKNG